MVLVWPSTLLNLCRMPQKVLDFFTLIVIPDNKNIVRHSLQNFSTVTVLTSLKHDIRLKVYCFINALITDVFKIKCTANIPHGLSKTIYSFSTGDLDNCNFFLNFLFSVTNPLISTG